MRVRHGGSLLMARHGETGTSRIARHLLDTYRAQHAPGSHVRLSKPSSTCERSSSALFRGKTHSPRQRILRSKPFSLGVCWNSQSSHLSSPHVDIMPLQRNRRRRRPRSPASAMAAALAAALNWRGSGASSILRSQRLGQNAIPHPKSSSAVCAHPAQRMRAASHADSGMGASRHARAAPILARCERTIQLVR